jgi:hypothetical protein
MIEEYGALVRVLAVAQSVELPAGGRLYVTAIEVWEGAVVLHAAEQLPEFLPPGEPIEPSRALWMLSDDLGTPYTLRGGGASGSQAQRTSTCEFAGTVPTAAKRLFVVGPGMTSDQAVRVPLD